MVLFKSLGSCQEQIVLVGTCNFAVEEEKGSVPDSVSQFLQLLGIITLQRYFCFINSTASAHLLQSKIALHPNRSEYLHVSLIAMSLQ